MRILKKLNANRNASIPPVKEADILHDPFWAMTLPSLGDFRHLNLILNEQCHYSDSVKCDCLRALAVENLVHICHIYTVNKCEDNVWDGTKLVINEMNANMSTNDLICLLKGKE